MTVDDLAGICMKEFEKADKKDTGKFESIEKRLDDMSAIMVTRPEVDSIYQGMLKRFDDMDARFNRLEEKMDRKFDAIIAEIRSINTTLKDHDERMEKMEQGPTHKKS